MPQALSSIPPSISTSPLLHFFLLHAFYLDLIDRVTAHTLTAEIIMDVTLSYLELLMFYSALWERVVLWDTVAGIMWRWGFFFSACLSIVCDEKRLKREAFLHDKIHCSN